MSRKNKLPRAAGTRTMLDVLMTLGRRPSKAAEQQDAEAVRHGAGRTVGCALRGAARPYPKGFRHGVLDLAKDRAIWRPYWYSLSRQVIAMEEKVVSVKLRPRNPRTDWNIKSAGLHSPDGPLPWIGFSVLVCETPQGWFELAVPTADVPLVRAFFGH